MVGRFPQESLLRLLPSSAYYAKATYDGRQVKEAAQGCCSPSYEAVQQSLGARRLAGAPLRMYMGLLMQEEHTAPRLTYHCIGVNPSLSLSLGVDGGSSHSG